MVANMPVLGAFSGSEGARQAAEATMLRTGAAPSMPITGARGVKLTSLLVKARCMPVRVPKVRRERENRQRRASAPQGPPEETQQTNDRGLAQPRTSTQPNDLAAGRRHAGTRSRPASRLRTAAACLPSRLPLSQSARA